MCPLVKVVVVKEREILLVGAALGIDVGDSWWYGRGRTGYGWSWRRKIGEVLLVGQGEDLFGIMLAIPPVGTVVGELNREFLISVDSCCLNDIDGIPV